MATKSAAAVAATAATAGSEKRVGIESGFLGTDCNILMHTHPLRKRSACDKGM